MMALLAGPSTKLILMLTTVASVMLMLMVMIHQHDQRVLAEATVAQQAATIADMEAQHKRMIDAEIQDAAAREAATQRSQEIMDHVRAAPPTDGCVRSPAVNIWLREKAADFDASATGRGARKSANVRQ